MVRLIRAAGGEVHIQVAPKSEYGRNSYDKKQGVKEAA